jgi:hypothetical protein
MYDIPELKERLVIIKTSSLDDATILDENYRHLIKEESNPDEREQFIVLRSIVLRRINKLLSNVGTS